MENFIKVFYSPSGTTRRVADLFEREFVKANCEYDLLRNPPTSQVDFESKDVVLFCLPVFYGRIPKETLEFLEKFNGNSAKAIPVVVYGNRAYEDSLLELTLILKKQKFRILGAAAFVAQHSIFPNVAAGRPDERDAKVVADFAEKIKWKIKTKDWARIDIDGNDDFKPYGKVQMYPKTLDGCTGCGKCVEICPVDAISLKDGKVAWTEENKCITCTACIKNCPMGVRRFAGVKYKGACKAFEIKNSSRKEPKLFL